MLTIKCQIIWWLIHEKEKEKKILIVLFQVFSSINNSTKIIKINVGNFFFHFTILKNTIESIYDVKLTYDLDENITIKYSKSDDITDVIDIINNLKENIVLDKSKYYKARIPKENRELYHEYHYILNIVNDRMVAPSVSYDFFWLYFTKRSRKTTLWLYKRI